MRITATPSLALILLAPLAPWAGCPSSTPTPTADGAPSDDVVAVADGGDEDAPRDAASASDGSEDAASACAWTKMAIGISISRINGLAGTSTSDLLAVGAGPWEWMVIRYDGAAWHNEIQGGGAELFDIAVLPGGDAVAVGASSTDSASLIVTRHGSSWAKSTLAQPAYLRAVWADAGGELFAVGYFGALWHYAGGQWQSLSAGAATDESFNDVWGTSPKNVYAVGSIASGTIFRYDGSSWSEVWQGKSALRSIWGSSATDIYAVGLSSLLHYDGAAWQPAAPTLAGGAALYSSVWGTSADHVVVGGTWINAQGKLESLVLTYDGAQWTRSPIDSDLEISALWGPSSDELYAVGSSATEASALLRYACP